MSFPRYKAGPVEYWLAEAATQFVNGFISGLGGGALAGTGTSIAATSTGLWVGDGYITQILVGVFGMVVAALGSAFKQVIVWHHQNPFPNPWPRPTGTTQPPFPEPKP